MQNIISIYQKFICNFILPLLWPVVSFFLNRAANKTSFIEPKFAAVDTALVLSTRIRNTRKRSLDYNLLALNWAIATLNIPNVQYLTKFSSYKGEALIITNDWFKSYRQHLYFFLPTLILAYRIRKKKGFVWVLMGDTCNLKISVASSILVSFCGGAIVLQQNTQVEGSNFGLPHVSGPNFWYITPLNFQDFYSNQALLLRSKKIIVGVSGDKSRGHIFKQVEKYLVDSGYELIATNHQYEWPQYLELLKNTRINIASSLLQSQVKKQNKFIQKMLPKFTVTNRVWEGFCSGAVVVTQKNSILDHYGFKAGLHYLDIEELELKKFTLPSEVDLQKIASEGQVKFLKNVILLN
jgi:hypothetical protein